MEFSKWDNVLLNFWTKVWTIKSIFISLVEKMLLCDALRDLVPFVQFKKLKSTPGGVFFTFFKLYKWYQIAQRTTYIVF